MPMSPGQADFQMAFEISAVTLAGGIASGVFGGMMPLLSLIGGGSAGDQAFGHFRPLPNTALILNQVGHYPFASLAIAANAIIKEPLPISMLMICPVQNEGGYAQKLGIMTALQSTLARHCANGGTFNVATPSFFFSDLILTGLHDCTGEGNQPQVMWKWDFEKPLITQADAQATQNQLLSKISQGLPTDGSQSGPGASGAASASAPQGSSVAAATPSAGIPSFGMTTTVPYLSNSGSSMGVTG